MTKYYYVVDVEFKDSEITGYKNITVYDIDTQTMDLIVVGDFRLKIKIITEVFLEAHFSMIDDLTLQKL